MIIPIRCFTCGAVISDRWEAYVRGEYELVAERDAAVSDARTLSTESGTERRVDPARGPSLLQTAERPELDQTIARGKLMDDLGIRKLCCRRHFLGNVDLMDEL